MTPSCILYIVTETNKKQLPKLYLIFLCLHRIHYSLPPTHCEDPLPPLLLKL